jgi:hypothetical protein
VALTYTVLLFTAVTGALWLREEIADGLNASPAFPESLRPLLAAPESLAPAATKRESRQP